MTPLLRPEITEGDSDWDPLLLGLTNTISTDLLKFTSRLLSRAQLLVLVSSAGPIISSFLTHYSYAKVTNYH